MHPQDTLLVAEALVALAGDAGDVGVKVVVRRRDQRLRYGLKPE